MKRHLCIAILNPQVAAHLPKEEYLVLTYHLPKKEKEKDSHLYDYYNQVHWGKRQ